jgi:hypothetical protein
MADEAYFTAWLYLGDALGPILGRADVDSQHTEAARTSTRSTASAKATDATATKKRRVGSRPSEAEGTA